MSHLSTLYNNISSSKLRYKNLLVVIKQTAYEEYSQLKLRGQAPKALRWNRLESRFQAHTKCVTDLLAILRHHNVQFSCVNRVELDRQHLANKDLVVAVGGDGTVLSSAHFLDHGTIPLVGINSDPMITPEERSVTKQSDERRSHGALCMCTARTMEEGMEAVLYEGGDAIARSRTRIHCVVKSTFSETRLVPALNDILISNPSPAAVSRFRMGWLEKTAVASNNILNGHTTSSSSSSQDTTTSTPILQPTTPYGTVTRFGGIPYHVTQSINVWSSGMWICTATGSTAAMAAAGGSIMADLTTPNLQYLIREHMMENATKEDTLIPNNGYITTEQQKLHIRWNSHKGRIFIDGSHLTHNLELGDEILIDNHAPPLQLFERIL